MTFLQELQSLEESTKRKILVVSTVVVMVIVVYFWLAYFNSIIAGGAQPAASDQGAVAPIVQAAPAQNGSGFWGNVGNGAAIVGQSFAGGAQWIVHAFQAPKQYEIKPSP